MTMTITIAELEALKPCAESMRRVKKVLLKFDASDGYSYSAADARAAGCTYEDIIWVASAVAMDDENVARRLTGFLNDNAKRVLHIFEEAAPDDILVRKCIEATDAFLAGEIEEREWDQAARAARTAWDARTARAAWDEFYAWQFDSLIEWLGPVAPEPLPIPERKTESAT